MSALGAFLTLTGTRQTAERYAPRQGAGLAHANARWVLRGSDGASDIPKIEPSPALHFSYPRQPLR